MSDSEKPEEPPAEAKPQRPQRFVLSLCVVAKDDEPSPITGAFNTRLEHVQLWSAASPQELLAAFDMVETWLQNSRAEVKEQLRASLLAPRPPMGGRLPEGLVRR
jgi:hypothetical protein